MSKKVIIQMSSLFWDVAGKRLVYEYIKELMIDSTDSFVTEWTRDKNKAKIFDRDVEETQQLLDNFIESETLTEIMRGYTFRGIKTIPFWKWGFKLR